MSRKLKWQDIAQMYSCGRSKALLIIHTIGATYVGRTPYIDEEELEAYLRKYGEVRIKW